MNDVRFEFCEGTGGPLNELRVAPGWFAEAEYRCPLFFCFNSERARALYAHHADPVPALAGGTNQTNHDPFQTADVE
nr:hypothetical protein [Gemmata sp. SH-PL17]